MKDNFFAEHPEKSKQMDQCFSCHMPKSSSTDIPHVTVTDHYIRTPISTKNKERVKKFIGLYAINENLPDNKNKVKAYIAQFEKFLF